MTSEVNLKELADELNFASSVHLNKFCKIWFGMTPSEVRQTFILKKICIEIECVKDNIFYIS